MFFPGKEPRPSAWAAPWPRPIPARAVFDEVDEALGTRLSALIWEGDIAELTLTQNAQPALMATSIARCGALEAEGFGMDQPISWPGTALRIFGAVCGGGAEPA